MNSFKLPFTLQRGQLIVSKQLEQWKSVLKPEKYSLLEKHVQTVNKNITNPYQLFRGNDMYNWIHNNLMVIQEDY